MLLKQHKKPTKKYVFSYTIRLKKAKYIADITTLFTLGFLIKKENNRVQIGFIKRTLKLQRTE